MHKIRKFWPEASIFPWNFAPVVLKISHLNFWLIFVALWPKIDIWFDQGVTRWVKFENFDREGVFCFETSHQWCVKFLFRIFYPVWPFYGQKFRFGTFDWCATKWVKFKNFDPERLFYSRTLHPVVRKTLQDFFHIFAALWPKIPIQTCTHHMPHQKLRLTSVDGKYWHSKALMRSTLCRLNFLATQHSATCCSMQKLCQSRAAFYFRHLLRSKAAFCCIFPCGSMNAHVCTILALPG